MATTVIRIRNADDARYDRIVTVPAGMTPREAVNALNAGFAKIDEADNGGIEEGRTGENLDDLLTSLGIEYVSIIDAEAW